MSETSKVSSIAATIAWPRSEQGEGARASASLEQGSRALRSEEVQSAGQTSEAQQEEKSRVPLDELEPLEHFRAEDPEALAQAVERMEQFMQRVGRDLSFRLDDNTGKTVVTVYVRGTEDVVRQIPPEEMLALAERMREVQGLLFNGEA
ncbi:MAG: flagellar protein FlaG [Halorhodospira sp.]